MWESKDDTMEYRGDIENGKGLIYVGAEGE